MSDSKKDDKKEEKVLEARIAKIKKDVTRQFKKYTQSYLDDAKDTDCTPTEDQAVKEVFENGNYIFETNEIYKYLTVDQQKQAKEACRQDIETDVRAQYRKYIDKNHPEVNGQSPYHVPDDNKRELAPYIKNIEAHMMSELNDFLGDCAKHGVCPNQQQMNACYEGWMNKYWKQCGPSFQLTEKMRQWMLHELEGFYPTMDKTYHAYADTVQVTNTYPDDYVGVTVSAPPNPRYPGTNTPEGAGPTGKGGSPKAPGTPPPQDTTPKESQKDLGPKASIYTKTNVSFSGCDMVVSANMKTTAGHVVSVVMGSVQTVSYSIYRKLSPILNIGNVNAKDYVGGPRTIAGSLVFTVFNKHWASQLMDEFMESEGYASTRKVLMDEVAPIDLTIAMANEYGVNSRLAIYGIRLFSEGQVMSINDIYTENTYQYVALNIDYLANVNATDDVWAEYQKRMSVRETITAQTSPVNKGDTSRVESHVPEEEKQKYPPYVPGKTGGSGKTPGPGQVTGDDSQKKPAKAQTQDPRRSEEDTMHGDATEKDPRGKIDQRIGNEAKIEQHKSEARVKVADHADFNGKTIEFQGKTRVSCNTELGKMFADARNSLIKECNEGRIKRNEIQQRMDSLEEQREAAGVIIQKYFDEQEAND